MMGIQKSFGKKTDKKYFLQDDFRPSFFVKPFVLAIFYLQPRRWLLLEYEILPDREAASAAEHIW